MSLKQLKINYNARWLKVKVWCLEDSDYEKHNVWRNHEKTWLFQNNLEIGMVVSIYCAALSHTLKILIMRENFQDEFLKCYIACLTSLCRFPCIIWYCFEHVMYKIKRLVYSCIRIVDSLSTKTSLQRMIAEVLMHSINKGSPWLLELMSPKDVAAKFDDIHCKIIACTVKKCTYMFM